MRFSEEELRNIEFAYREKLNIPERILFGVEIEYVDALFDEVIKKFQIFNKEDKTKYFSLPAFYMFFEEYLKWNCVHEGTVQYIDDDDNIYGGELTSPILFNDINCFKALKKACELLNSIKDLTTNFRCGLHIHVDRTIYGNDAKTFIRLLKTWMIFENVIYRFASGESERLRSLVKEYARPINKQVYKELEQISKVKEDNFNEVIKTFRKKYYGITFFNTQKSYQAVKNTFEIRMFNGTTDPTIIQNDINFITNFLLYMINENYDEEYIDYEVKKFTPFEFLDLQKIDMEHATRLADMIYNDDIDKLYFMKQYLKQFESDKLLRR